MLAHPQPYNVLGLVFASSAARSIQPLLKAAGTKIIAQMRNYPINFVVKHPNRLVCFADGPPLGGKKPGGQIRGPDLTCFQIGSRRSSKQRKLKLSAAKTRSDLETVNENLPRSYGGAERDRTVDPLLAKQVLSQLSYSPTWAPAAKLWWAWVDSNYRPHPYQGCALTN